jgi:hypothetical protein
MQYYIVDMTNKYMTRTAFSYTEAIDVCHDLNKRRPDARFSIRKGDIYAH